MASATAALQRAGVAEPRLNAELLLADLLSTDRGGLLVRRGKLGARIVILRHFEQGVALQRFLDLLLQVHGRQLKQADGLLQLGCHR